MAENIILYKPIILFLGHWQPVQTMIRCCIMQYCTGLQIRVCTGKLFFLFLNQNICCGYSKEPSQWDGSFENPKHMSKLMGNEINAILGAQFLSGLMNTAYDQALHCLLTVMPRSHNHGLDTRLATDVHSWQSLLVRSLPYCIPNHT